MNVPVTTNINVTVTITSDGKGGLVGAWSGSSYVDSKGNFNLSTIQGPVQITTTISTALQVRFNTPALQALYLGKDNGGKPTGPYSGSEFTAPGFVNNSTAALRWIDQNGDGFTYKYLLQLWLVDASNPNGTVVPLDPRIVNRGTSP